MSEKIIDKDLIRISRSMSKILRHDAVNQKIPIRPDGHVKLVDLISAKSMNNVDKETIFHIVEIDDKQRFSINEINNEIYIRSNQGHSIKSVDNKLVMDSIEDHNKISESFKFCIHGTKRLAWSSIKTQGLGRVNRNAIHCSQSEMTSGHEVLSGFRSSSEVLIYLDIDLMSKNKIEMYVSQNGVICIPGLGEKGILPTAYFLKVVDAKTKQNLEYVKSF